MPFEQVGPPARTPSFSELGEEAVCRLVAAGCDAVELRERLRLVAQPPLPWCSQDELANLAVETTALATQIDSFFRTFQGAAPLLAKNAEDRFVRRRSLPSYLREFADYIAGLKQATRRTRIDLQTSKAVLIAYVKLATGGFHDSDLASLLSELTTEALTVQSLVMFRKRHATKIERARDLLREKRDEAVDRVPTT